LFALPPLILVIAAFCLREVNWLWMIPMAFVLRAISPLDDMLSGILTARDALLTWLAVELAARCSSEPTSQESAPEMTELQRELRKSQAMVEQQEMERKLLSGEIHDGILQQIIVAHMLSQVVQRDVETQDPDLGANLASLQTTLSQVIQEGRRLIHEFRPLIIDENNIVDALTYYVNDETAHGTAQCRFVSKGEWDDLPPLLEDNIFRIIQEAFRNARKYSQAKSIDLSLERSDGLIRVSIQDDGVGFDPSQVKPGSYGLKSIRHRAILSGGRADIHSQPGHGTKIVVELPVEPASARRGSR
jgi:signal transduction histidine kinase